MSEPQACGNCKHWDNPDAKWGICRWPLPVMAYGIETRPLTTSRREGTSCPTWEAKEKA